MARVSKLELGKKRRRGALRGLEGPRLSAAPRFEPTVRTTALRTRELVKTARQSGTCPVLHCVTRRYHGYGEYRAS